MLLFSFLYQILMNVMTKQRIIAISMPHASTNQAHLNAGVRRNTAETELRIVVRLKPNLMESKTVRYKLNSNSLMGRGYYSYFLWSMLPHLVKSVNRRCLALYAYNFSTSAVDFIVFLF